MKGKTILSIAVLSAVALLLVVRWIRSGKNPEPIKRTQVALGTFVDIEVRDLDSRDANRAITAAFQEVQRIHREFSPFNKSGPVWQANHGTTETVAVSQELHDLLLVCDAIHKKTNGAFDPAMEALFQIWRVRDKKTPIPTDTEVTAALALSGWLRIGLSDRLEITRHPGVEISFGAIAKGYAVDRMAAKLKEAGVENALVNAGGEIRTLGKGWVVGIQHPSIPEALVRKINLSDRAVATSGDYEQYLEDKGKRYHHILDPVTGYPATGCSSVTVIAESCIEADAYATGMFVMGPKRGLDLANRIPGLEAMVIDGSGTVFYSKGFENYLWRQP